jgi:hypothetical protein
MYVILGQINIGVPLPCTTGLIGVQAGKSAIMADALLAHDPRSTFLYLT